MLASIAAVSKNNVIGNKGLIPWKVKGEQKRFKELTLGKTVIMGRKSFEEIGKPLPGRKTIVLSNTISITDKDCITVGSLKEALDLTKGEEEVYIAGGGRVYEEAMDYIDKIYLTIIDVVVEGDTYFPVINENRFKLTYKEPISGEIPFTYYTYEKA